MARILYASCLLVGCIGSDPPGLEMSDSDATDSAPSSTDPTGEATESATTDTTPTSTTTVETDSSDSATTDESSDSSGTVMPEPWTVTRNGPGNWDDVVYAIAIDPATGDVVVAGALAAGIQNRDPWLARYAPDGTEIWSVVFDQPSMFEDAFNGVAIDSTGGIVVTGQIGRPMVDMAANADLLVVRFGGDGTQMWDVQIDLGGENIWDTGSGIALDSNDSIFVSASARTTMEHINAWVLKLAPTDGEVVWDYPHNGPASDADFANAIAVNPNDEVCWAGAQTAATMPIQSDILVGCLRNDGVELWTTSVADPEFYDFGNAIAIGDDAIYVAGSMAFDDPATPKVWLGAFTPAGMLTWSTAWGDDPGNAAFGLAIADDGGLWVTGSIAGPDADLFIGRWAGRGDPTFTEVVGEPGVNDTGRAVAVAPGRVLVGGWVDVPGQGADAWLRQLVP